MKKTIFFLLSFLIIFTSFAPTTVGASYNSELKLDSEIVALMSLDDGTFIFDKNADMRSSPASLTKIVTAVVALENCSDLDVMVTAPGYAIRLLDGTDSSNAGILDGETMSLRDLLHCMLVQSANEAANIIADYIGNGSIEKFIGMMNSLAKELGCENSVFKNAHGLDEEGQYTTAYDMMKIAKHAIDIPVFKEIMNLTSYTVPATNLNAERKLFTTNYLTKPGSYYYYEYASGVKTGTTDAAGRCIISTANKNGYSYLAVVMRGPYKDVDNDGEKENVAFLDCRKVFKWTFENIRLRVVADPTQTVTTVAVNLSWKVDHVRLVPSEEATALVPSGVDASGILIEPIAETIPKSINAPTKKGDVVGKGKILYADEEIGTVDLVVAEDIDRSFILFIVSIFKKIFSSLIFKVIFALGILLVVFYIIVTILYHRKLKKKKLHVVRDYRNMK